MWNWFITTLAILLIGLLPGIEVAGFWLAVLAAAILGLLNMFIKPLVILITLPINIISLGLFTFIINALLLYAVAGLLDGIAITGFWWAVLGALIISFVRGIFGSSNSDD